MEELTKKETKKSSDLYLKESMMNSMTHRFRRSNHVIWSLIAEKLNSLNETYGSKKPLKFAKCCQTFYISRNNMKEFGHSKDWVVKVFTDKKKSSMDRDDVVDFVIEHGIFSKTGFLIPGFDLLCQPYEFAIETESFTTSFPSNGLDNLREKHNK